MAALVGLALLVTVSYAGHASSGRWVPVAMVADVVHLAGVSAWLGGLALLCVCVLRPVRVTDEGPQSIAAVDAVVARFSSVAFVAVVAIVASGVVQGLAPARLGAGPVGHHLRAAPDRQGPAGGGDAGRGGGQPGLGAGPPAPGGRRPARALVRDPGGGRRLDATCRASAGRWRSRWLLPCWSSG